MHSIQQHDPEEQTVQLRPHVAVDDDDDDDARHPERKRAAVPLRAASALPTATFLFLVARARSCREGRRKRSASCRTSVRLHFSDMELGDVRQIAVFGWDGEWSGLCGVWRAKSRKSPGSMLLKMDGWFGKKERKEGNQSARAREEVQLNTCNRTPDHNLHSGGSFINAVYNLI